MRCARQTRVYLIKNSKIPYVAGVETRDLRILTSQLAAYLVRRTMEGDPTRTEIMVLLGKAARTNVEPRWQLKAIAAVS